MTNQKNWAKAQAGQALAAVAQADMARAKAACRQKIRRATVNLVFLEAIEEAGGQVTALELMKRVMKQLNDERDPRDMCVEFGFHPEEVLGYRTEYL
jgi:hypothetical protein